jgi:hypothetical protein
MIEYLVSKIYGNANKNIVILSLAVITYYITYPYFYIEERLLHK